jgi:Na+-driven multidrug efflux pump
VKRNGTTLLKRFVIELIIYGILVTGYLLLVLRGLGDTLARLYAENPVVYAFGGLLLIVVQALVLDWVTSFLLERLGLE